MDRDKFIMENHNLIYSFAKRNHLDLEEYYDLLAIALIKAVDNYKEETGVKFSTYAYIIMRNHVSTNITKRKRDSLGYASSLDNLVCEDTNFIDIIPNEEETKEIVLIPKHLTNKEKEVLNYYLQGHTQREISKFMGIHLVRVREIYTSLKYKFKAANGVKK